MRKCGFIPPRYSEFKMSFNISMQFPSLKMSVYRYRNGVDLDERGDEKDFERVGEWGNPNKSILHEKNYFQ